MNTHTHDLLRTITEKAIEIAQIADQNVGASLRSAKLEKEIEDLKLQKRSVEVELLSTLEKLADATSARSEKKNRRK